MIKIPMFTTTIKRKYLDMKLMDWRKDGYFYEYKEVTPHWNKRLEKLVRFMNGEFDGEHYLIDGVFLCGREYERAKVVSITRQCAEAKYWIPERYEDAITTDKFWVLKCIPTWPVLPTLERPYPHPMNECPRCGGLENEYSVFWSKGTNRETGEGCAIPSYLFHCDKCGPDERTFRLGSFGFSDNREAVMDSVWTKDTKAPVYYGGKELIYDEEKEEMIERQEDI